MNYNFQVNTNICVCTGYFIRFILLENVVLLVKSTSLSCNFEFIKVSIVGTIWFLLENWFSKNTVVRKLWKKNWARPVFLEELQADRNFSMISLHFNKIPNSLRPILHTYPGICIFCVLQKIVLQKPSVKTDTKLLGQSCAEIWWRCDEIHILLNLGQKYEGDLRY